MKAYPLLTLEQKGKIDWIKEKGEERVVDLAKEFMKFRQNNLCGF